MPTAASLLKVFENRTHFQLKETLSFQLTISNAWTLRKVKIINENEYFSTFEIFKNLFYHSFFLLLIIFLAISMLITILGAKELTFKWSFAICQLLKKEKVNIN